MDSGIWSTYSVQLSETDHDHIDQAWEEESEYDPEEPELVAEPPKSIVARSYVVRSTGFVAGFSTS